jgi:hypothetical protein
MLPLMKRGLFAILFVCPLLMLAQEAEVPLGDVARSYRKTEAMPPRLSTTIICRR